MSIEVKVPSLPESVADATVAAIHKKVGEAVTRDENLIDLETDKVVLEVPSPADGVLQSIKVKVGDTVTAQQILLMIEAGAAATKPVAHVTTETSTASRPTEEDMTATSPGVRRLLAEHGLEPSQIKGSGKEGRITKEDVETFISTKREKAADQQSGASTERASIPSNARESRRVPMSRLRATIAERLLSAQHNAAMLTTFNEVNLQAVMDLRTK
jgi:2-oxoglutarate dehydrogenase E2 component (dihydrolipoamide succinyltransferase)